MKVIGLYNCIGIAPSFALPVYQGNDTTFHIAVFENKANVISHFQKVDLSNCDLVSVPNDISNTSREALYGFILTNGKGVVANRKELTEVLTARLHEFVGYPFLLHEIGAFLGDAVTLEKAKILQQATLAKYSKHVVIENIDSESERSDYYANSMYGFSLSTQSTQTMGVVGQVRTFWPTLRHKVSFKGAYKK